MEFRRGEGTSFSAPLVSGAAALLFATDPGLQADQTSTILTRTAVDADRDTGCLRCDAGRDPLTGSGLLDIGSAVKALDDPLPDPDRYEANDRVSSAAAVWGRKGQRIKATIDYWDDRVDIYKVKVRRGQKIAALLRGPVGRELGPLPLEAGDGEHRRVGCRPAVPRRPVEVARVAGQDQAPRSPGRLVLPGREDRVARVGQVHAQVPEASSGGVPSSSSVATSRICRAGLPTTTARAGTSARRLRRLRRRPLLRFRPPGTAPRLRRRGRLA